MGSNAVTSTPTIHIHIHHMPHLFRAHDDHILCLSSAREFASLPFWEGNRLVKHEHVEDIQQSLKGNIHSLNKTLFRAIAIIDDVGDVQWYVFDGQHRATILHQFFEKNPFEDDFEIPVMWKMYDAKETALIHKDFLDCNRASPIEWTVDPKMMTNQYIDALLLKFQAPATSDKKTKRQQPYFFREGKTKRPYMSIEKLREEILKKYSVTGWTKTPDEFAEQAFQMNEKLLEGLAAKDKRSTLETSMLELGFALANVESYIWM
jgi:hypothetical protein